MSDAIKIRAVHAGDVTTVRVLIPHPMESGNRKDASGVLRPAHFITDVRITCDNVLVFEAAFGPAVSKDPNLSFKFRGGRPGAVMRVVWNDNKGATQRTEATVGV